jgi:hypothetical protein
MKNSSVGTTILIIITVIGLVGWYLREKEMSVPNTVTVKTTKKEYSPQTSAIAAAIKNMTLADCDGVKKDPWYCNRPEFTLENMETLYGDLYAWGIGNTDDRQFVWAAKRTKDLWGTIYFEDSPGALPKCEDISDFPAGVFDGKFSKCLENGSEIDRFTQQ